MKSDNSSNKARFNVLQAMVKNVQLSKFLALALLISTAVLVVIKVTSIPEAYRNLDAYLNPRESDFSLTLWFTAILSFELVLVAGRFFLGYCLYCQKQLKPWLFYTVVIIVALSGFYLSGLVFALLAIGLRIYKKL